MMTEGKNIFDVDEERVHFRHYSKLVDFTSQQLFVVFVVSYVDMSAGVDHEDHTCMKYSCRYDTVRSERY